MAGIEVERAKHVHDDDFENDHISDLPDYIIHDILSFVESPDERSRTSVLSKRWYHDIWSSILVLTFKEDGFNRESASHSFYEKPVLVFQPSFEVPLPFLPSKYKFHEHVTKCLLRYQKNGFHIKKFSLFSTPDRHTSATHLRDRWMPILAQFHQIQELHLEFRTTFTTPTGLISFSTSCTLLNLPQSFFSTLRVLKVVNCQLHLAPPHNNNNNNNNNCFNYNYNQIASHGGPLWIIHLDRVSIPGDQVVHYITSSCRCLEEIILRECNGLQKFRVFGLDKLRHLELGTEHGLHFIEIESLSLESFHLCANCMLPPRMGGCKNLKALKLERIETNWNFGGLTSQFPLLEALDLITIYYTRPVWISSTNLKTCRIMNCQCLLSAYIQAPNPLSLTYHGALDILLEFLLQFNSPQDDLHKSSTISSFELHHFKLEPKYLSSRYFAVSKGLLWNCCPHMLTLCVNSEFTGFKNKANLIKDLYEKLNHTTGDNGEIELFEAGSSKGRPMELRVLLDILPTIVENQWIRIKIKSVC